jgi:hypothetical protein
MRIKINEHRLTDNSKVFDVVLITNGAVLQLAAYSSEDAWRLAEKLTAAIKEHSCEDVETFL